jgi:hypothetical protein
MLTQQGPGHGPERGMRPGIAWLNVCVYVCFQSVGGVVAVVGLGTLSLGDST